ncbi:MAG: NADPH:quinone oxidoreductase family protein [Saprospiraceae bacterium]|nr:NADPH:quinone oxidoreductase family protein [Saprospiraceae bacterium]
MKAILCKQFGPPSSLTLEDIPSEPIKKGHIRIQVRACGLNFPDTLIIQGKYQFKPDFPFSPGSDIAGVVTEVGDGVKNFKVGDEAVAMIGWGGFREEVVAAAKVCFPKPPNMDFSMAASFMMTYGTSYHALKDRGRLKEGETLLVLGASGGVGLTAVELGKKMGAKVIAAASTAEKLALCKAYGADEVINYTEENIKERVKELTEGNGANVIYDPVGGVQTELALRAIAWKGRYLVVGFAAGDIPKIPLNLPLLKGCQIVGVFWGAFAQKEAAKNMQNTMELMQYFFRGELKPHIHATYPLEKTPEALQEIMDRKVKGKIILEL